MPELPEVETIRKTLSTLVIGKRIEDVTVRWPNIIKFPEDTEEFKLNLIGQTIHSLGRRGKFIQFHLDDYVLISHLRMEGKYFVVKKETELDKHTHVIFSFTDGEELRYLDVRKFGTMHLYPKSIQYEERAPLNKLGPEPFDEAFTAEYFYEKLQKTHRPIKAVLLDQQVVTGLGNIYVDETLFKARVNPEKTASMLTKEEAERIRQSAILTLEEAVQLGGTTIRSYVNSQGEMGMFQQELSVYGRAGEPCLECGSEIRKLKVAGRGTHICPECQKQ
ncbi:formamidopyrimidine-DNA glycosylase [Compostibacillus humi]|jgi:formamidopyrimidine-DNA glycosylase|uniref:Formamidopyrimidine-DNA glycosylase n=1 Tax=Compostibacillus humi TaxID=1245525 RepID=A0A8J2ZTG5_9BACI|nr:DNA-formamidopyrimidine glycosylase [Compostibacillus humi]GGH75625.1 formamidopyrimidine-DNA glycosylase [Compostibacillus humi]